MIIYPVYGTKNIPPMRLIRILKGRFSSKFPNTQSETTKPGNTYTRHRTAVRQDLMGAKLESNGFTGAAR